MTHVHAYYKTKDKEHLLTEVLTLDNVKESEDYNYAKNLYEKGTANKYGFFICSCKKQIN